MLHPVTFRVLAVVACGWLLVCDALALSLGPSRGVALIGRPLELAVPVTDASADNLCARADVFYGDNRVSTGVGVAWEAAATGSGVLRVRSGTPVDEPMVTVYLRAGCGNASTRRYVLLSEPPAEVVSAVSAATIEAPAAAAAAATAPAARASSAAPRPRRDTARRASTTAGPKLTLEPLDLSIDRDPVLRLSSELRSEVSTDPQRRAEAAALWKALQRDPDQAVQEALRLQGAERELRSAREAMQRNAVAVGQLRGEIEQAGRSRSSASVAVVALAIVLFALLAWLAWRWLRDIRVPHVRHWFEANSELALPPMPIVDAAAARRMNVPTQPPAFAPVSAPAPAPRPPAVAAPAARAEPAAPAELPAPVFRPARGAPRTVGAEELIDLHDKAEFFLSIGEQRQAMGALEAHVRGDVETSAMAWLELLELYHRFGLAPEYDALRAEFAERFDVLVPAFADFDLPAAPLEAHADAIERIVDLWPTRPVLDLIAELLFRKPGLPDTEPFGLDAYRELVLLYHVARDIAAQDETLGVPGAAAADFDATGLQPLEALDPSSGAASTIDPRMVPPASPHLGVDIELGDDAPPSSGLPLDFDVSGYEPSPEDAPKAR